MAEQRWLKVRLKPGVQLRLVERNALLLRGGHPARVFDARGRSWYFLDYAFYQARKERMDREWVEEIDLATLPQSAS